MGDIVENYCYIDDVPNEILLLIFKFLTAKQLLVSRQVCKRWKQLLEALLADDSDWERFCNLEFPQACKEVKSKSPDKLQFIDIYKCLSLWQRLDSAKENIDEFCHSTRVLDEIRDINVLKGGLIMVHRRDGIIYFEMTTQTAAPRERIFGDFNKVVEVNNTVITYDAFLRLSIIKRTETNKEVLEVEKSFNNIKYFMVTNSNVYFINMNNDILSYGIGEKDVLSTPVQYRSDSQRLFSMSIYNKQLHGLWIDRTIRVYQNNEFITLLSLDTESNMMHILWKYNFIENIDWRTFYVWMSQLRRHIPNGPLNSISTLRVYGDLFFVGSQSGVLTIYHKPFINGELDLFNTKPVRQYNFSYRVDIPILSVHPILTIEVVEVINGHKILIVTPKKIIVINLFHDPQLEVSKALIPYTDWKTVILKD